MTTEAFLNGKVSLCCGDAIHFLRDQPADRYDSVVTDPPYALVSVQKRWSKANKENEAYAAKSIPGFMSRGFMGKQWDTGDTAHSVEFWAEVFRVLKPGAHLVAFGGTRTYHRMVCAIEDAGFEVRDQIGWAFGSGFPKSHDVSKGIDRAAGAERELTRAGAVKRDGYGDDWDTGPSTDRPRYDMPVTNSAIQWSGWGTALKPAWEPICLARKPLSEKTVAANVLRWGTGAINIDACRVAVSEVDAKDVGRQITRNIRPAEDWGMNGEAAQSGVTVVRPDGRWPANIIHDGSEEVIAAFPETSSGEFLPHHRARGASQIGTFDIRDRSGETHPTYGDEGSAARFFYTAKADADDRLGSKHPTVKPVDLMQWLVRLVTPKNGLVLDPFAGTGTTAEAAFREGMRCTLVEREAEYQDCIRRRMRLVMAGPNERSNESIKARNLPINNGPLFERLEQ